MDCRELLGCQAFLVHPERQAQVAQGVHQDQLALRGPWDEPVLAVLVAQLDPREQQVHWDRLVKAALLDCVAQQEKLELQDSQAHLVALGKQVRLVRSVHLDLLVLQVLLDK